MTAPFVIFDFDGVIADTERLHLAALQDVLTPRGVALSVEEYESRYLGFTDHDLLIALRNDQSLSWSAADLESIVTDKAAVFDALLNQKPVVFPSAVRCIGRLVEAGATLAIASGAFRNEIERILASANLGGCFPVIVGADEYAAGKPAPDPFLEAARRIGLPAALAVVIEDTPWGLTAARAAGCRTVAVTHTYARTVLVADLVVDSLDEITVEVLGAFPRSGGFT